MRCVYELIIGNRYVEGGFHSYDEAAEFADDFLTAGFQCMLKERCVRPGVPSGVFSVWSYSHQTKMWLRVI